MDKYKESEWNEGKKRMEGMKGMEGRSCSVDGNEMKGRIKVSDRMENKGQRKRE